MLVTLRDSTIERLVVTLDSPAGGDRTLGMS
jgi:hypothetical protein